MDSLDRKTKIVATLGPATATAGILRRLVRAGLDVARLNFSHGTVEQHLRLARLARSAAREAGRPLAILQDLQGPRIRIGAIEGGTLRLRHGDRVELAARTRTAGRREGGRVVLPLTYPRLAREVRPGARLFLRDGSILLRVVRIRDEQRILARVERGGPLTEHAGLNAPDSRLSAPALTPRDRLHIAAGAAAGFEAVALSFVRDGSDVRRTRRVLVGLGSPAMVVAKIERREALENLDEILREADGVMVARGDLGVECPGEQVPLLQKRIIRGAIRSHTFVITATQMLESMRARETPTRAEVSDVANAILDGTDAVMLSGETSTGAHPVLAVREMERIARAVDPHADYALEPEPPPEVSPADFIYAVSGAAVRLAVRLAARAIVPFTLTGRTAAIVASYRPRIPILAFTPDPAAWRRLAMIRGVRPFRARTARSPERMFEAGVETLRREKLVRKGDVLVLLGGHRLARGSANLLKVHRV